MQRPTIAYCCMFINELPGCPSISHSRPALTEIINLCFTDYGFCHYKKPLCRALHHQALYDFVRFSGPQASLSRSGVPLAHRSPERDLVASSYSNHPHHTNERELLFPSPSHCQT